MLLLHLRSMNLLTFRRISLPTGRMKCSRTFNSFHTVQSSTSLWRALEDGSGDFTLRAVFVRLLTALPEEPIDEADLYRYQRYRWLSREPEKLAVRHRKFHLQGLIDASVKAVGVDGINCVKLLKCVEGQFNKAFLLTMSNGSEIIARLPNPKAGPAFYTTASEVATRHFIRNKMDLPIPRICDWSADRHNPVGVEYILEEKAPGQPLGALWGKLSTKTRLKIVEQIVDAEKKLASISFPKHGYIYYESDLKSASVRYEQLQSSSTQDAKTPNFVIGPSANPSLWDVERARMNLDRGPWESVADYARALGMNELEWATSYSKPRMNFHRSMDLPETPTEYITLLKKHIALSPYFEFWPRLPNRISHPDLHLDNIFIDSSTYRITAIIDWQHAHISPIYLQRSHPQMLELSAPSQSKRDEHERLLLNFYYNAVKGSDPVRSEAHADPLLQVITNPILHMPRCWGLEDFFSLRNALIAVVAHWDGIGQGVTPCPVDFGDTELLQHQDEMDMLEGISKILQQLQDDSVIPMGGMVRPEFYQHAMDMNNFFKAEFVSFGETEKQRELHAKVWPYQ